MKREKHGGRGHGFRPWLAAVVLGLVLVFGLTSVAAASPPMEKWVDALPVPPVAQKTFKPGISGWADYYEINMTASQHQFFQPLPDDLTPAGPATVWTYGQPGKTPVLLGPTIVAQTGRPVVVKWINNLPTALADFPLKDAIDPTIEGAPGFGRLSPSAPGRGDPAPPRWAHRGALRWDAHAVVDGRRRRRVRTTSPTPSRTSTTSRRRWSGTTTTRWASTRFKPYLGLAAAYVVFDKVDNGTTINGQKVPSGYGKYHLPLVIQDKQFNDDGTLFYPTEGISPVHPVWVPEFFADTPVVNGKAYPKLDAQPRRYRLRLLNGSQARFYNLHFHKVDGGDLPFWVIGSEQGLLPKPAKMFGLADRPRRALRRHRGLHGLRGSTVMMTNDANEPYPDGDAPSCDRPHEDQHQHPSAGERSRHERASRQSEAAGRPSTGRNAWCCAPRDIVAKET